MRAGSTAPGPSNSRCTMGVRMSRPWKAEMRPAGPNEPSCAARYYARARALGGMNGGNTGTIGLDNRTERCNAPRQSQTSTTTPGRIATRQCKSSVRCVGEDVEVWRCPWWAVCISSILSVCTRHITAATTSRHVTSAGSILEVLEADTTNMASSLLRPRPSSSTDLLCSDAEGK